MKFMDNRGVEQVSRIAAMCSSLINKIEDKLDKCINEDESNDATTDDAIIDAEFTEVDNSDVKDRDDVFIPGVTPKVQRTSKHTINIDFENYRLILKDESGKVVNVTQIDSRLRDCPLKDVISMIYETPNDSSEE